MYYHPNHYKKLRAASRKLQASSLKQAIQETVPWNEVLEATSSQASSRKLQAPRTKLQAPSPKLQAPRSVNQKTFE
jgi:hypothetical protein